MRETLEICNGGRYENLMGVEDIGEWVRYAENNTEIFGEDFVEGVENLFKNRSEGGCKISVTGESTVECGRRLSLGGIEDIVALNFASGVSVGGGVIRGAVAQEEDLCRSSGLYGCLDQDMVREYYEKNIVCEDNIYRDSIIYSPLVPFFRDNELELTEPYRMSIVTSCAPCVLGMDMKNLGLREYVNKRFMIRMVRVLSLMSYMGHRDIILGAWGCGAFGNDVYDVAGMFKMILDSSEFAGIFDNVVFAIYSKDLHDKNYIAFKEVFG